MIVSIEFFNCDKDKAFFSLVQKFLKKRYCWHFVNLLPPAAVLCRIPDQKSLV